MTVLEETARQRVTRPHVFPLQDGRSDVMLNAELDDGSEESVPSSRRSSRVLKNDLLLHEAVIKNDADAVKKVLKEHVDINSRNNYGRAPIHWAASRGATDIMELLINAKCDIEARDRYGMRPLLMAAWHGHTEAVQLLINCGASVVATNKKQYTLLMCAARNNRLSVVNFLLDSLEHVDVDLVDLERQTALHHAAQAGHREVVARIVQAGANTKLVNKQGRTALHLACEKGHVDVVEFLLRHEAQIEARDEDGNTPLHLAVENKHLMVTQLLLEYGTPPDVDNHKGMTALHIASSLGCRGIIDTLLQYGSDVDKQSKNGNTPLHQASEANDCETVELLIAKGADLNALNARLQSPIHIAAEHGYTDICKVLLAAGANIEQREQGGRTPLYIAARGSFTAIVDMIIKTARLDYPEPEESSEVGHQSAARRKWRQAKENGSAESNDKFRQVLWKLAHKQLGPADWKRLAHHWAFTEEQIKAIEHQYTGPNSYKDHAHRMLTIWSEGLSQEVNPARSLYEGLCAINKKSLAESIIKKLDEDLDLPQKAEPNFCKRCSCSMF